MEEAPRSGGSATFDVGGDEQDVLFGLLSHQYRRFVLHYLDEADGVRTVGEVATELGAWQADVPPADRSATSVDVIESALHHCHLPKMAAANVIEYNHRRGTVTLGANADDTAAHLDEIGGT